MAGQSILVVDDETAILELLDYNLTREGFSVSLASSGEEAIGRARTELPDLILLDLMLAGIDGLEVCRMLKSDPRTCGIPVVMVTAKGEESDVISGLEHGADDYVPKPFSPKVLIARVNAVLRRKYAALDVRPQSIRIFELKSQRRLEGVAGSGGSFDSPLHGRGGQIREERTDAGSFPESPSPGRRDRSSDQYGEALRELQKMALVDNLTELPNRRCAERSLLSALDEMKQRSRTFGVFFLDIDHFKQVNDLHGHDVGDAVLRMVARTLSDNLSQSDFVSRWGGEEFFVIVLDVDRGSLLEVGERLRAAVEQAALKVGSRIVGVTVSIGGTLGRPGDTPAKILKRTDKLMYRSKVSGRNLVSIDAGGR